MRALLTGASGFVGPYLLQALEERGWDVMTLDRTGGRGAQSVVADLTTLRPGSLRHLRLDAVFHLAGQAHVPTCNADPGGAYDVNVRGASRLLRAIRPGPRILFVSSGDIYGRARRNPIPEDEPFRPTNAYSASKACADALMIAEQAHRDIVVLRPFNHTGPGQSDRFVAPAFARQIALAERGLAPPTVRVGNLAPVRDFLDVRDVVRAYLAAFEKCRPSMYNIASGVGTPIRHMLRLLLDLAQIRLQVRPDRTRVRSSEPDTRVGESSRFRRETGWSPQFTLSQTLHDLLDFERRKLD